MFEAFTYFKKRTELKENLSRKRKHCIFYSGAVAGFKEELSRKEKEVNNTVMRHFMDIG